MLAVTGLALPIGDEIRTECGARARLVWCQDAGDGSDTGAEGNNLRLMGFDTDDRQGERCLLTNLSNYAKPMLTPDGQKIVFSNRQKGQIKVVGWNDSSSLKIIGAGIALAVWRDSLTETDWVYAGAFVSNAAVMTDIRRFRLDKPEISESVWTKTPLDIDNFQLSADGLHASGVFPWPACGLAALPDGDWEKYGDGCWPSLSPDNSLLLWIFDGAHRNLTLCRTKTGERWVVNINSAPGIDGFEVYHPRWSNSALFMVMTGPYKLGEGNNRIRGGGRGVEIYLGKFSRDFKKIERWIQVTHNESADFFPDMWLAARQLIEPVGPGSREATKTSGGAWPVSYNGLVFFWQNRSKANTFKDNTGQRSFVCRAEAKGRARYGRHFELAPSGGAFIAEGGAGELFNACAASRQLGIEILITPVYKDFKNSIGNTNLLPVAGYAARNGSWNFLLGQKGNRLVFQLRSAKNGPDYELDLCALPQNKSSHVIISCSSSSVACYLNGEQASYHDSVFGGNWEPGSIVFGNEWRGAYDVNEEQNQTGWIGWLENIALYARWIGLEEARKKHKAGAGHLAEHKPLPALNVKAKLIAVPQTPAPESIAPYRRALTVGHYKIEEVTAGTCSHNEVMAAQWVILDAQTLKAAQRRPGETYSLRLEPFSDHPELEGERLIMDGDRFDLPLYCEVE